jgi:polysaccharide biosynthesis protein PelD
VNTAAVQTSPGVSKRHAHPFGNLGRLRRLLAPAVARPFAIVESMAIVLVVLGLARGIQPDDPLFLRGGFPWLWLVATLVALRYGTLLGALAGAMLLASWSMFYPHGAFPALFFAGGLCQTILAGHFGDTWGSRAQRASGLNDYLNDRLVALTNSHYLLRLSHERLEKDLLSRPTTLRDSITELRKLAVNGDCNVMNDQASSRGLLAFVAQACQIEIAALYPVRDGKVSAQSIAHIGDTFELDSRDELVRHALATSSVAHLKNAETAVPVSQYLVCAPVVSADGDTRALLVIKRMPFLSLNYDNLQLLLVLLCYYADGVEHSAFVQRILNRVPHCPPEFALDLGRLTRLQQKAGVASSLVALVFPRDEAGDSLFEHVMRRRRSLDVMWPVQTAHQSVLLNLMPATDTTGIEGYLARIEASLLAQFNIDLERARIGVHTLHLEGDEPGAALARLLKRSGVDV